MLEAIANTVSACRALCEDVEFVATDATRSDGDYLAKAIETAKNDGSYVRRQQQLASEQT
jgi:2-isopropylmalate synthase